MTFLVIIYQTNISLHPIFLEDALVSRIFIHSYCFSQNGPGRFRYAMIYYYDIAILTYKIPYWEYSQ